MIVQVKQGSLMGTTEKSLSTERTYYSFLGIPYAKPPVGELRFMAPEPVEKWDGIYDATAERNMCIQKDMLFTQMVIGNEDCLYLNVHTPEPPSEIKKRKPVMVFIHGGAFVFGGGSIGMYAPDHLINHDVLIVTINYRLHALGFLNLGIADCAGNMGLKDQVLALEWIKENISAFGGDPENITLFGESAGAASVHYHMISPLSNTKGLFHRCILQSGCSLNVWAFTDRAKEHAFQIGRRLGYVGPEKDSARLLEFLKSVPAADLAEEVTAMHHEITQEYPFKITSFLFVPSLETVRTDRVMLPAHPRELIKSAPSVPVLFGVNDQEGVIAYMSHGPSRHMEQLRKDIGLFAKHNLLLKDVDEAASKKAGEQIAAFYFGGKPIGSEQEHTQQLTNLYGDAAIVKDMYDAVNFVLTKGQHPVYTYLFAYDGELNVYKKILGRFLEGELKGACHADELGYLFVAKLFPPSNFSEESLSIINKLCSWWTNFAKTGNPNGANIGIEWPVDCATDHSYLVIDKDLKVEKGIIYKERIAFWKNLFEKVLSCAKK